MSSRCLDALALAFLAALSACDRRQLRAAAPERERELAVRVSALQPGTALPAAPLANPYAGDAYAISQGQRLFTWYNCVGCHSNGGGGMGPALMDSVWLYGSEPQQIYATIVQGRPRGMPSFGGHIPELQVWQLVAYVRSLSGLEPKSATPARSDNLEPKPAKPLP
jgi:cytochrome c oxidase cbb3-type subunit 3